MPRLLPTTFMTLLFLSNHAIAQSCSGSPWTTLTNETTADAIPVMDNFNCVLSSPHFSGNVGIGTTSPGQKLHIYAPAGSDAYALIENGGTSDVAGLLLKGGAPDAYWLWGTNRPDIGGSASNLFLYNLTSEEPILAVTPDGKVGIGTMNPSQAFHLYSAGGGNSLYALIENAGTTPNNDLSGLVVRGGAANANWIVGTNRADIGGAAANLFLFNGTTSAKVVVTSAGYVGIGTGTPTQALDVNGQIKVEGLASASSTPLCVNANVLASCSSSLRYKRDIKPAHFGLSTVEAMHPITFKWKDRDERDFGFLAEDIAKIDPTFVTNKDGKIEGVKYGQLTAVLAAAIKELKAIDDKQAAEISELKAAREAQTKRYKTEIGSLQRRLDLQQIQTDQIASQLITLRNARPTHIAADLSRRD